MKAKAISGFGVLMCVIGEILLILRTTNKYYAHIMNMGSIVFAYLGLIIFGLSIVTFGTLFQDSES